MAISWNQRRAYKRERLFEILIKKNKTNYKQRKMVQANKRTVMVLGSIGSGKSSFLNTLSGVDLDEYDPFRTEMYPYSYT